MFVCRFHKAIRWLFFSLKIFYFIGFFPLIYIKHSQTVCESSLDGDHLPSSSLNVPENHSASNVNYSWCFLNDVTAKSSVMAMAFCSQTIHYKIFQSYNYFGHCLQGFTFCIFVTTVEVTRRGTVLSLWFYCLINPQLKWVNESTVSGDKAVWQKTSPDQKQRFLKMKEEQRRFRRVKRRLRSFSSCWTKNVSIQECFLILRLSLHFQFWFLFCHWW